MARLKSRALSNLDPTGVFRNLLGKEADFPARLSLLIKLTLEIRSQITGSTGIPFVSSQTLPLRSAKLDVGQSLQCVRGSRDT